MDKKNIILGLDISTACIGISIVEDDGENRPVIREITHIAPKIKKGIEGIEALILRKNIFEEEFLSKIKGLGITECVIESPLCYATGNSNADTVTRLLQFNGIVSEAVYRVLGVVPQYMSSYEARMYAFPTLLAIRRVDKKGEFYKPSHYVKAAKDGKLVLFGEYAFDCDKKAVMMDKVSEMYPDIEWALDKKGNIRKENFDACDSMVCVLAYINRKRHGSLDDVNVTEHAFDEEKKILSYTTEIWGDKYERKIEISDNKNVTVA